MLSLNNTKKILAFLLILLSLMSIGSGNMGKDLVQWRGAVLHFFKILFLGFCLWYYHLDRKRNTSLNKTGRWIIGSFLAWVAIAFVRGVMQCSNMGQFKLMLEPTYVCLLPIVIYAYSSPELTKYNLGKWLKIAPIIYVIVIMLAYGVKVFTIFYFEPIVLLAAFTPYLKKNRQRILMIGFVALMTFMDLGNRSQILKCATSLGFALVIFYIAKLSNNFFKYIHWAMYTIPIVLLFLGITGKMNIFEYMADDSDYRGVQVVNETGEMSSITSDSRTFLYVEVINSAVDNNYVLQGRALGRGNDSKFVQSSQEIDFQRYGERVFNEVGNLNIFTWLGLIGLILFTAIFVVSSCLCIYKSNSLGMKIVGCLIAFEWMFAWIENEWLLSIQSIAIWILIAMGMSNKFRNMTTNEFKLWYQSIFRL